MNRIRIGFKHKEKTTTCYLKITVRDIEIEHEATVTKYFKDVRCKEKARKYALEKVLRTSGISRKEREHIWGIYCDQKPGGRW